MAVPARDLCVLLSDFLFKLVIVGDSGVGKSCLLLRFAVRFTQDDSFSDNYISTIGVDFVRPRQRFRTIYIDGRGVKLQIWDTAGQERFRTITSAYYRGADGALIVFDKTASSSFEHVPEWVSEIKKYSEGSVRVLVGNKSDQVENCQVNSETAVQCATSYGMEYVETSARSSSGVEDAFVRLAKTLMKRKVQEKVPDHKKLSQKSSKPVKNCCCVSHIKSNDMGCCDSKSHDHYEISLPTLGLITLQTQQRSPDSAISSPRVDERREWEDHGTIFKEALNINDLMKTDIKPSYKYYMRKKLPRRPHATSVHSSNETQCSLRH